MQYPSLLRRCLAISYDLLLLFSLCLATAIAAVAINQGQAIPAANLTFKLALFTVIIGFYVWFWTHGGQTIGMRAWRIKLVTEEMQPVNSLQAIVRIILAIPSLFFAIGFLWAIFDRDGQTLYDRFSKTTLILIPK